MTLQNGNGNGLGPQPFDLSFEDEAGRRTVRIEGELDLLGADRLTEAVLELGSENGKPVVLDLGQCTFIDSAGVAAVVRCWEQMRHADGNGSALEIEGASGQVRRVLELTGLATLIASS